MSNLSLFDAQDWSTIISEVFRQNGLTSAVIEFEKVQEVGRTDPHALEIFVYPDRIELRRITRDEAAVIRANDPSIALFDKDNQSGRGKVVPIIPKS